MASLSLQHINKTYPNGFQAVKDFNLEIEDKDFIIFISSSIFLFFLCPVSSGRVGSSGCAMVTLPYGQNFERENVTVPPWREAVTFCALSADINCS